ncbi:MAG: hypothetical protein MOB07_14285 [Acidobacteria bacterium]|nr:hypothetical protein [Acidobacteriota bacterium]
MQRRTFVVTMLVVFLTLSFIAIETGAYSDPTGIYARVDKVVLEPDGTAPERIQIWGAFALASKEDRNTYNSAQRGYLYFSCKQGKAEICRKEWADLKAIAGTDQVVGFGSRNEPRPRVRKAEEKVADPNEYPVNIGLFKMGDRQNNYLPVRELKALPKEKN